MKRAALILIALLCGSASNVSIAKGVFESRIIESGKIVELTNGGKITTAKIGDCVTTVKWGGNMFHELESFIEDGFYRTTYLNGRYSIPLDSKLKRWNFKGDDYRYIKAELPRNVRLPVKTFPV